MHANPSLTQSELSLRWDRLHFESPEWFRHLWLRKVEFLMTREGLAFWSSLCQVHRCNIPVMTSLAINFCKMTPSHALQLAILVIDACFTGQVSWLCLAYSSLGVEGPSKSAVGGQAYLLPLGSIPLVNQGFWIVHSQNHQWSKKNPKWHKFIPWLTDM